MTKPRFPAHGQAALAAVTGEYLATLVHHVYGGLVFASPERLVMAAVFTAVFAVTLLLHALDRAWARGAALGLGLVFWGTMLGAWEGGYNHVYASLRVLFGSSPPGYHADGVFQSTGWLTFAFAVVAIWSYVRGAWPGDRVSTDRPRRHR